MSTQAADAGTKVPAVQEVMKEIPDSDLELFDRTVTLRNGTDIFVREFTLRQRDALGKLVSSLGEGPMKDVLSSVVSGGEDGEDSVDAVAFVRVIASKIGDGVLTAFLASAIDVPENRELWKDSTPLDYILDNVRLKDEIELMKAILATNDIGSYLGNLLRLSPLQASLGQTAE